MQRSIKKRQRSENWLQKDKIILKELVRERLRILENKHTDTNSNSMKVAAWNDVRESFNRMCNGAPRTVAQLKGQWCLLKLWARRSKAGVRQKSKKTDTGLLPPQKIQCVSSEDVSSRLSNEFVTDTHENDSDSIYQMIFGPPQNTPLSPESITEMIIGPPQNTSLSPENIKEMIVGPPQNTSLSPENIKEVCNTPAEERPEIQYRKELHAIQMENERQRNKNLKLKEILLKETIQYYKRKNNN